MPTYQEIQDRINDDYLYRTDFEDETKSAIIRAIKHYEKKRFWFNQTSTVMTADTSSITLALPADFLAVNMVEVSATDVSGSVVSQTVVQRNYERVKYQNALGESGVPEEVAFYSNNMVFYPKPASAYPITLSYVHVLPELSADTDTNKWLSAAEDLIVFHAAADVAANTIRGMDKEVEEFQRQEMRALQALQEYRNDRLNTDEDLSVLGPVQTQKPAKSDGQ